MRKLTAVPIAGFMALTLAASAMAGPNVGNYSSSLSLAQASWDSYDEATDSFQGGYVTVSREQGSSDAYAEYSQYSEQYLQCTGADTPDDPDDDTFGVIFSNVWGYGPATLTIARNDSSASASGTLDVGREHFNECTGESGYEELQAFAFSLDLTATSGTIRESGRGSFHLPGEFNSHSSYKSTYCYAAGTFSGVDGVQSVTGMIGTVSWRDHSNG
ncbi:MAG TPA: hypothetical protein VGQ64_05610 [Candidatus Limnocylindrales bacterium]|nr:hypothetical protein [Candidatus Limnocylindrales bacterium]